MLRAHFFNHRLIAICVQLLIYDLIAAPEMKIVNAHDFDNFDKSSLTTSPIAAAASSAINESVIAIGQHENKIELAAAAANLNRNGSATFEPYDLLPIIPTATTATAAATSSSMTSRMTTRNSSAVAMSAPTSSSAAAAAPTSFSASTFTSSSLSPVSLHSQWQRILSRPKRYLSFPVGASLSVAVCFTVGIIGNPRYNYMAFGLNWGTAYDLPNITWVLNHLHGFARHPVPAVLRRRTRSALYKEIENVVENMGYNGRDCVLRALCESRQYFQNTKMGMLGEMLRVIFSLPKQRIFTRELREDSNIALYDHAYRKARSVDCTARYDCAFSLLELAFGKYSTPPPGYFENH